MATWEVDIDVTVRRTLVFSGPGSGDEAMTIVGKIIAGEIEAESFWKWTTAPNGRVVPAERVLTRPVVQTTIREVSDTDR
jgi:hypothetical protein